MAEETIHCTARDGAIVFSVRVVPRASRSRVAGAHDGALRVRVAAPPVDGAANEELTRTLAQALEVPRRAVEITAGHASKLKQVRVHGIDCSKLKTLAGAK
ncbi:MAG TPA: DUF167 domain-containing protein [Pyrinomonadaceae bacterium]